VNLKKNMMIHIEGEDHMLDDDENEDNNKDMQVRAFLEDLK
jgi:hypothetical protein